LKESCSSRDFVIFVHHNLSNRLMKMYTKEEIIQMCEIASKDMKSFYAQKFINYRGKSKEGILYTEIIAEWLLENLQKFDAIQTVTRKSSYDTGHTGEQGERTNREEEYVAKSLFDSHKDYEGIGKFIDYQTPLKDTRSDKGLGKIDLLSQNDKEGSVYILELKKESSTETMLRCVLEGYTYLRIIDKNKLFQDFKIESCYELKAAPLVYCGGFQYKEYIDKNRPHLHKLMDNLCCKPFFIKSESYFEVVEP